jgi:hypothetical protein
MLLQAQILRQIFAKNSWTQAQLLDQLGQNQLLGCQMHLSARPQELV